MYLIRQEKINDLKDGRTNRDLSDILEITENYLSLLFNGKRYCSCSIAMALVSLRKQVPINRDTKILLNEYFIQKEE